MGRPSESMGQPPEWLYRRLKNWKVLVGRYKRGLAVSEWIGAYLISAGWEPREKGWTGCNRAYWNVQKEESKLT